MGAIFDGMNRSMVFGTVDSEGRIKKDEYGQVLGRVENGVVYDSEFGGNALGRVDSDGRIYDSEYGGNQIGLVDGSGSIQEGFGGQTIATAEAPHVQWSAAAYLLLLR